MWAYKSNRLCTFVALVGARRESNPEPWHRGRCLALPSTFLRDSPVLQGVRRAHRGPGGHLGGGSHGRDRPAGRQLRPERREAGGADAAPAQRTCGDTFGDFFPRVSIRVLTALE